MKFKKKRISYQKFKCCECFGYYDIIEMYEVPNYNYALVCIHCVSKQKELEQ